MATDVGPHDFVPLRRRFNGGRCRACYIHERYHPIEGWTAARPLGDNARPGSLVAIARGGNSIRLPR